MPSYISAYDTEAVYAWWDAPTGPGYQGRISYEGERLAECIAGVRAVAQVHLERQAPASFFIVAELLQRAAPEFRAILDEPLFDIQCHSFTHKDLIGLADDDDALQRELVDSKKLIEDTFARPVIGLTAPGGYTRGFIGQERILHVMWEAGYRYMRTVGAGPDGTMPAPLNRPFWYAREGFPGLLEMPSHAWHDNILTGQPGKCCGRPNSLGPIRRKCPWTPKACTQPTPRASTTCNKQTCPTTCPSSTLGPSIASTAAHSSSTFSCAAHKRKTSPASPAPNSTNTP